MIIDQFPKAEEELIGNSFAKKRMNLQEFRTFWDLSSKLVETREQSLWFLLDRASAATTKAEQRSWYACYMIIRFVEENHRFPRQEELNAILDGISENFSTISHKEMTQSDFWSISQTLEIKRHIRSDPDEV